MANRWKGNFVVATEATSSGTAYTGKANGSWSLNNQIQQKQAGLWARAAGVPAAPTIGTAIKGDMLATVAFTAPSDNGGQAITSYTATSSPGNITGTGTSSPVTVNGLTNGTTYTFTVVATNASGNSLPSAASNSIVPSPSVSAPDAPTGVAVSAYGITFATIAFTAPVNSGSSPITSYTVTSSPGNLTASVSQSGSGQVTVTGLTAGTAYTFTATATNAIGTSVPSSPSSSITTLTIPTTIGQSYGGGYYGGKYSASGKTYYLIVAPKATGSSTGAWGPYGTTTTATSDIDGYSNTIALNALGSAYVAAQFCKGLTINGFNDWYLGARYEYNVLYYFLKPTTDTNWTTFGSNPYALSPQPVNTNYTSGSPAQTTVTLFKDTGSECFQSFDKHWSSTQTARDFARFFGFDKGADSEDGKLGTRQVRAIRKVY